MYTSNSFPIRTIDFSDPADVARHDRMVSLVDRMLALHKQLQEARTPHDETALQRQIEATDRQIDALVYELYGLTEEGPDYYWEDDGSDREILDPTRCADSGGWWTCHRDTKKGDLIFLWRTSPKKDIGYLIQAESDAYSIADDNDQGWHMAAIMRSFINLIILYK
ncbi:hypothetical protein [Methanothrix soehngenii]|uniref:hypothetical protein n=1 Tax=Methanothrix soehngenii TaxID=2223 RepID=UPI00300D22E1